MTAKCTEHRWQTSITVDEVVANILAMGERVAPESLQGIAKTIALGENRWIQAKPDERRICGICGLQGRVQGDKVVLMLPNAESPTTAT